MPKYKVQLEIDFMKGESNGSVSRTLEKMGYEIDSLIPDRINSKYIIDAHKQTAASVGTYTLHSRLKRQFTHVVSRWKDLTPIAEWDAVFGE